MTEKRYAVLDGIRGFALLNMIVYHAVWDFVYVLDFRWQWYRSEAAYIWQLYICWTFIFLSGFCQPLGRKNLKRGIQVFLAGILVSFATVVFVPQNRILCGVLTLLGSCMLLVFLLEPVLKKCLAEIGFLASLLLFALTRNINRGYLGFENLNLYKLPGALYRNLLTAYLGFPPNGFYSSDYFSLFPWLFLYIAGYFFCRVWNENGWMHILERGKSQLLEWFGRRSLVIYLVHQPVMYLIFACLF